MLHAGEASASPQHTGRLTLQVDESSPGIRPPSLSKLSEGERHKVHVTGQDDTEVRGGGGQGKTTTVPKTVVDAYSPVHSC